MIDNGLILFSSKDIVLLLTCPLSSVIILGELCNEEIIDIFDMAKVLIKLRKLYNLPLIDISASVCSFVRTGLKFYLLSKAITKKHH